MADVRQGLDRRAFVARFGGIYEHSSWVAERAFDSGELPGFLHDIDRHRAGELRSRAEAQMLADVLAATLAAASEDERRGLIIAHPDLVGRAALAGKLTDESTSEQRSAGLDQCTPDELARFQSANATYREKFGFPFVMAVRGADRATILANFEQRLQHDAGIEFRTALLEIDRIALLRLEALVEALDPAAETTSFATDAATDVDGNG